MARYGIYHFHILFLILFLFEFSASIPVGRNNPAMGRDLVNRSNKNTVESLRVVQSKANVDNELPKLEESKVSQNMNKEPKQLARVTPF